MGHRFRFPVLDLLRIAVLHPDAGSSGKDRLWTDLVDIILQKCSLITNENASSNKLIAAVPMLCLRIFANSFRGGKGASHAVTSNLSMVLSYAEKFSTFSPSNKNLRLTVATLILNVSSYLNSTISSTATPQQKEFMRQILNTASKIFQSKEYESEATNRTLFAVGTVLLQDDGKEIGRELNILQEVLQLTSLLEKGTVLVEEITTIMH